jgi:hypothetical protein
MATSFHDDGLGPRRIMIANFLQAASQTRAAWRFELCIYKDWDEVQDASECKILKDK